MDFGTFSAFNIDIINLSDYGEIKCLIKTSL